MPSSWSVTTRGSTGPAIKAALEKGTAYVGAMGSRKTQTRRREWLLENGVTEEALAAVRAPIGLDIGADEPGEIAVSILAEIVAVRRGAGATVGAVSERSGPIHPDLEPGTATCPGGVAPSTGGRVTRRRRPPHWRR